MEAHMAESGAQPQPDISTTLKQSHHTNVYFHWVAIVLGILGILFGIDAYWLQRKIHSTVTTIDASEKRVNSALEDIESSVSTRFIGRWPDHFPEVTKLISRAAVEHDKLFILSDFVDPWSYTLADQYYKDYYLAMIDQPVAADILVFDRATAIDRVTQQFTPDHFEANRGYFEDKQGKRDFTTYDHYLDFYTANNIITKDDRPKTYLEFITLIFRIQDKFCEALSSPKHRIRIRTLANENAPQSMLDRYAYFYWINSDKGMVLSFRRYGYHRQNDNSSAKEHPINLGSAFLTNNVAIVGEFASQFNARWEESLSDGKEVSGRYCFSSEVLPSEIEAIRTHTR